MWGSPEQPVEEGEWEYVLGSPQVCNGSGWDTIDGRGEGSRIARGRLPRYVIRVVRGTHRPKDTGEVVVNVDCIQGASDGMVGVVRRRRLHHW